MCLNPSRSNAIAHVGVRGHSVSGLTRLSKARFWERRRLRNLRRWMHPLLEGQLAEVEASERLAKRKAVRRIGRVITQLEHFKGSDE